MKTVSVVIPVYKEELSHEEQRSFVQCMNVLRKHSITIVTHSLLNTHVYSDLAQKHNKTIDFEYFKKDFFADVNSYNRLLYSRDFYARFQTNEYILIYQLDGFVFRDELEEWCSKGFDYIGAPWLFHYGHGKYAKSQRLYKVGNGGVSLRRVSAFLERFENKMPISVLPFYVRNVRKNRLISMIIKTLRLTFSILVSNQNVEYCLQHCTEDVIPEDCFWADALSSNKLALKTPDVMIGARFAFEKAPSYLYEIIGGQLPFACHAYEKYEYEKFWKERIHQSTVVL